MRLRNWGFIFRKTGTWCQTILSEKLAAFFKKLHLATTLTELKIGDNDFDAMAARATRNGKVGHYVPLDAAAIKDILKIAL